MFNNYYFPYTSLEGGKEVTVPPISSATLLYIFLRACEVYRRPPRVQVGWFLVRLQPIAIDNFNFEISKSRYFRNSFCQVEESFCRDGAIVPVYGLVLITVALYKRFLLLPDKGCFENFEISKVRKSHSTPFDTKDQFRTGSRRVRSTPVYPGLGISWVCSIFSYARGGVYGK